MTPTCRQIQNETRMYAFHKWKARNAGYKLKISKLANRENEPSGKSFKRFFSVFLFINGTALICPRPVFFSLNKRKTSIIVKLDSFYSTFCNCNERSVARLFHVIFAFSSFLKNFTFHCSYSDIAPWNHCLSSGA